MVERDEADSPQLPPIGQALRELAQRDSGVEFIYAALNLLADRYNLGDVAIVLVSSAVSTRVFRLGGRDTDSNQVAALGTSPGVYCSPDTVPLGELEEIYIACQEAFSLRVARDIPERERPNLFVDDLPGLVRAPIGEPSPEAIQGDEPTVKRTRHVTRTEPSARSRAARVQISRILVLVDIAILAMTAAGIHGPLRLVLGLVLGIVIPGWCIVAPLRLDNAALEIGLVISVSLSLLMLVAQILETLGLWHLAAFEEITCVICLPLLLIHAKLWKIFSPRRSTPLGSGMPSP